MLSDRRMEELLSRYERIGSEVAGLQRQRTAYEESLKEETSSASPVPRAVASLAHERCLEDEEENRQRVRTITAREVRDLDGKIEALESEQAEILGTLTSEGMPKGLFVFRPEKDSYVVLLEGRDEGTTWRLKQVPRAAVELAGSQADTETVLNTSRRVEAFGRLSRIERFWAWARLPAFTLILGALTLALLALTIWWPGGAWGMLVPGLQVLAPILWILCVGLGFFWLLDGALHAVWHLLELRKRRRDAAPWLLPPPTWRTKAECWYCTEERDAWLRARDEPRAEESS